MNSSGELTAARLAQALNADEFVLYCQPIVPLLPGNAERHYFEILIRFREEEEKLLPPGTFFPLLEEAGLMPVMDRWVVRQVLRWLKGRHDQGGRSALPKCSVNLSGGALRDRHLLDFVRKELEASAIAPDRLSFEISLNDIRASKQAFIDFASRLVPLKCPLAVSGFGAAPSLLFGLHRLGVEIVKIDGGLIHGLKRKQASLARLRDIADACVRLGITSIAEMIEDQETITLLREARVDYAQGFGVGLPIPLSQLNVRG